MTTNELETILARTLLALQAHRGSGGEPHHDPAHAAAMWATLDLTRALAAWRQTAPYDKRKRVSRRSTK